MFLLWIRRRLSAQGAREDEPSCIRHALASRRLARREREGRSPSQKTPRQRARFARFTALNASL